MFAAGPLSISQFLIDIQNQDMSTTSSFPRPKPLEPAQLMLILKDLFIFIAERHLTEDECGFFEPTELDRLTYSGIRWYIAPIVLPPTPGVLESAFDFMLGFLHKTPSKPATLPAEPLTPIAKQRNNIKTLGTLLTTHLTPEILGGNEAAHRIYSLFAAMKYEWCQRVVTIQNMFKMIEANLPNVNELLFTKEVLQELSQYRKKPLPEVQVLRYRFAIVDREYLIWSTRTGSAKKERITGYKINRSLGKITYTYNESFEDRKKKKRDIQIQTATPRYFGHIPDDLPYSLLAVEDRYYLYLEYLFKCKQDVGYRVILVLNLCKGTMNAIKMLNTRPPNSSTPIILGTNLIMHIDDRLRFFNRQIATKVQFFANERRVAKELQVGGRVFERDIGDGALKIYSDLRYSGISFHRYFTRNMNAQYQSTLPSSVRLYFAEAIVRAVYSFVQKWSGRHGDLKFENFLIDAENKVRLSDYETAAKDSEAAIIPAYGTTPYQPPEFVENPIPANLTRAGDVYTTGLLLVILLAGEFWKTDPTNYYYHDLSYIGITNHQKRKDVITPLREIVESKYTNTTTLLNNMLNDEPSQRPTIETVKAEITKIQPKP